MAEESTDTIPVAAPEQDMMPDPEYASGGLSDADAPPEGDPLEGLGKVSDVESGEGVEEGGVVENSDGTLTPTEESDGGSDEKSTDGELDPALVAAAISFGVPAEHAAGFPSSESLQEYVTKQQTLHQQQAELVQHNQRLQTQIQAQQQQAAEAKPDPDEFKLDPEVYDEDAIKAFEGLQGSLNAKIEQLNNQLQQVSQANAQRSSLERESAFDARIAAADDSVKAILGKGAGNTLAQNSPELANRKALWQKAEALQRAESYSGGNLSDEVAFNQAVQLLYGDQIKASASEKAVEKTRKAIRDDRGRFTTRPTPTSGDPTAGMSGEQKAVYEVSRKMQKMGHLT